MSKCLIDQDFEKYGLGFVDFPLVGVGVDDLLWDFLIDSIIFDGNLYQWVDLD